MTGTVAIKMTTRGFVVITPGHIAAFAHIDDAFDFAQSRLEAASQLRDLSRRKRVTTHVRGSAKTLEPA
jgi:hypothetical protein